MTGYSGVSGIVHSFNVVYPRALPSSATSVKICFGTFLIDVGILSVELNNVTSVINITQNASAIGPSSYVHLAAIDFAFEFYELTMAYWAFDDILVNFVSFGAYNGLNQAENVTSGSGYRAYYLMLPLSSGSADLTH